MSTTTSKQPQSRVYTLAEIKDLTSENPAVAERFISALPDDKLVQYYNMYTGNTVQRFPDRMTGVRRFIQAYKNNRNKITEISKEKAEKESGSRRSSRPPTQIPKAIRDAEDEKVIIRLLTTVNPKKPSSASYNRFEFYVDGMTVRQAIEAGLRREDFAWDAKHHHIRLEKMEGDSTTPPSS